MDFTYRPLDAWPGDETPAHKRKRSPFTAGWGRTLDQLESELAKLRAKNIVMLVAVDARDFRIRDGHPKSNAKYRHPGVVIAFDSMHGPLKYACDTFQTLSDNVRAIALGLEALRKVERYGITKRGEQYRGWSALPPAHTTGAPMSAEEAARILEDISGHAVAVDSPRVEIDEAYRVAVKRAHPDAGGSHEMFLALTEARDVLLGARA